MAEAIRNSRVKEVPLSVVKDDLLRFLREAGKQGMVITRHSKPAGVLIGFDSGDGRFDYRLGVDLLGWFGYGGEGHETRINVALREYAARHRR